MPYRRAVAATRRGAVMLSKTIRAFSSSGQRRRRPVSTTSSRFSALIVWLSIRTVLNHQSTTIQGVPPRRLTPFNRGALINVGFQLLAPDVEYVCLHDVDRVPIDADYRWPEQPMMIIRHGLPLPPKLIDVLLSSVVLLQRQHFAAANGFSNGYWGWGYEDVDVRERLLRCGLVHAHRDGTFRSLPHRDLGSNPDGTPTAEAKKNQAIFLSRWFDRHALGWQRRREVGDGWRTDGLTSLKYTIVSALCSFHQGAPVGIPAIEKMTVDFALQ